LRAHQEYSGYGNRITSVACRFVDTLRALRISIPDVSTWSFLSNVDADPRVWRNPAFSLALAEYPVRYLPELLGYNLYRAVYGLCPLIERVLLALSNPLGVNRYLEFHCNSDVRNRLVSVALEAIEAYLVESADADGTDGGRESVIERMRVGTAVGASLSDYWLTTIAALKNDGAFTPRGRMMRLVESKGENAFGYHHHRRLNGQSVDDYLDPAAPRAEALLNTLARTHYVKPGNAAGSPLLTHLVQFGGPMYRIFTADELDTIAQWIESLPAPSQTSESHAEASIRGNRAHKPATATGAAAHADKQSITSEGNTVTSELKCTPSASQSGVTERIPLRELYHRLVNIEQYGEVLDAAYAFASEWLTRSKVGFHRDERKIPFLDYSPARLEQWLNDKHRAQVDSYDGQAALPPLSREQVIRQSVQLCPMVLIDGAWLQRFSSVTLSREHIGSLLYHIYADELGNGSARENHPNVYRELMAQMKVVLPEFGTSAFAWWDGFDDESFEVPTFWLAISRFPREFLPELLGVNLAMELSGVGGTYRQGRDMLRQYGFSSAFVDLHNTIDNVSTGHTAMAFQAITVYLDEIAARGSREDVNREWIRIWTGYRALKSPSGIRGRAFLFGCRLSYSIAGFGRVFLAARAYKLKPLWRASIDKDNHVGAP
jgi:hypothetical protein